MQKLEQENFSSFKLGNRPELDGIRGLSVLAVVFWHISLPYVRAGNIGVDVFFVLSGFLITTLLLQEWEKTGTISLKNFYLRRSLRLLPVLLVLLTLFAIYSTFYQTKEEAEASYKYILATLFYVANWVQVFGGLHHHELGHTWSLAVEEQFYIIFPLLLLAFLRLKTNYRGMLLFLGIGIIGVYLNRFWLWQGDQSYDRLHMSLDTRADAMLVGAFVSVLVVNNLLPKKNWTIILSRILAFGAALLLCWLVVFGVGDELYYKYGVLSLTAICVGFVIMDLMGQPLKLTQTILKFPPLVWVGRLSYGIYLWHIPVIYLIGTPETWSRAMLQGIRFTAVLIVAAISYYFIEKPFLKFKNRFSTLKKISDKPKIFPEIRKVAA